MVDSVDLPEYIVNLIKTQPLQLPIYVGAFPVKVDDGIIVQSADSFASTEFFGQLDSLQVPLVNIHGRSLEYAPIMADLQRIRRLLKRHINEAEGILAVWPVGDIMDLGRDNTYRRNYRMMYKIILKEE